MYEIKTTRLLKKVMSDYFRSLENRERKIAWCTSVGPAELLRSFGFEVYFPENHGALLGATRTATDFIPQAGKLGYSNHVCSYTTSDIGSYLSGKTPLQSHYGMKGIPKPDLIVYNTNQCREVEDWFSFFAKQFNCPIAGIHPPRYLNEVTKAEIDLVIHQHKNIIPACEKASGNKFDIDAFRETLFLSKEATLLWQQVLQTAKASPAPITFFDGTIHMGPIVVLRGTEKAKDYYKTLLKELQENISAKNGAAEKEQCRIFWDGMPIWGKNRMLSDLFIENNTSVVASTYCNSWVFDDFDEGNPFASSALAYTQIFINRSEKAKMQLLKNWLNEFSCDGIIFHDTKTCFNNSNAKFGLPQRLKEETGIPYLIIEGDLCDLRFFSEGQSITKIETFIEQLESFKVKV
ncbi:MAG TPA: 2-hydroxyacyl-CoA dehydratase family protein [Bacteroidia bacterium]|nr:2-hydroxyacyl-CoA dehydratase family protein [Bacteroidia bacterium]